MRCPCFVPRLYGGRRGNRRGFVDSANPKRLRGRWRPSNEYCRGSCYSGRIQSLARPHRRSVEFDLHHCPSLLGLLCRRNCKADVSYLDERRRPSKNSVDCRLWKWCRVPVDAKGADTQSTGESRDYLYRDFLSARPGSAAVNSLWILGVGSFLSRGKRHIDGLEHVPAIIPSDISGDSVYMASIALAMIFREF